MSKSQIRKYLKSMIRKGQEQKEKEKEDYCVNNYKHIKFSHKLNNLIFKNNAQIESLINGNGVFIHTNIIDFIGISNNGTRDINILLKGNKENKNHYDIIWKNKGE